VLTDAFTKPASAAEAMTTESGALAPAIVQLADAATISVDASLGNDFRVTINASRTMANPANPTDGQKITFQITQGSAGSSTMTWGSAYEFSIGLPQPTLSTTAGQTDLLGFIYNQAKAKWLLAAFIPGFASTTVTVTPPAGTYRLYSSVSGPTSPVSYSGPFMAGVLFEVTTGGCWLDGYWWWVCPSGQSTAPQTFALWAVYSNGLGSLVSTATVSSGQLTAGQWNFIPLTIPVPLAIGACYNACTGFSGSFPDTENQFGSGDPYSAGITSGPLTAFSDQSGSLPAPFSSMPQGPFGVAGTDPTAYMPSVGSNSSNFWMDVQVDTNAPSGTSYRLWPSYPTLPGTSTASSSFTLATEFTLAQACTLDDIWFYSPSGASALPTHCAIWNVASQTVVAGTDSASPTWSGAAGSGWVSCSYSGLTLPVGDYKVAVFNPGGTAWFTGTTGYWSNGVAADGITAGPLTAPGNSNATSPGQSTYTAGSWAYPQTAGSGENFWVDVEVTPA